MRGGCCFGLYSDTEVDLLDLLVHLVGFLEDDVPAAAAPFGDEGVEFVDVAVAYNHFDEDRLLIVDQVVQVAAG